ncbi:MAG TPA: MFS transporter [Opitutaceae bacterium]|jgi:FSR family fosmidomycin resistance protein-like MFS transporter|nr:MFS transporter [Opitutaceae bacterium]
MERSNQAKAGAVMGILAAMSCSHLINDTLQALIPSLYPILRPEFHLSFTQIGCITLCFQMVGSVFQPFVGLYTDKHPQPFSLAAGMTCTLVGLFLLSQARTYPLILGSVSLVGFGSAIFHPEASRVAKLASGGRFGFAQSLFQVGGNLGSALGPFLAGLVVVPRGQRAVGWFTLLAVCGIVVLYRVGRWYQAHLAARRSVGAESRGHHLSRRKIAFSIGILLVLILSKYLYLVSFSSYYTFYLISKFGVSVGTSLYCNGLFLLAVAAGTIIGGPVGDRYGRKIVIWVSILGVAPFTLTLPHLGLEGTLAISVVIGVILASAFSAILVYAQELLPGRTGLVAGLFFGFAFGVAGIGSVGLGKLADHIGIIRVFGYCAFLPLIGILTGFLPNLESGARNAASAETAE